MTTTRWEYTITVHITDELRKKYNIFRSGSLKEDTVSITITLTEEQWRKDRPPTYRAFMFPSDAIKIAKSPELLDSVFNQIPREEGQRGKVLKGLIKHETPDEIDYGELQNLTIYYLWKLIQNIPELKESFIDYFVREGEELTIDHVWEYWEGIDDLSLPGDENKRDEHQIRHLLNVLKGVLYLSKSLDNASEFAHEYDR
jgi:hypothetical protein